EVAWQTRELPHQLETLLPDVEQAVEHRLVGAPIGHLQVGERHRVEVVVGERDEAEAASAQLDDLFDDRMALSDPRLLAVGTPDRTEGAMLRAAAYGLNRGPHVAVGREQVPASLQHRAALDSPALVNGLLAPLEAGLDRDRPDSIAVALDHGMRGPERQCFVGKQRRVDAAEDDVCAAGAREPSNLVPPQRVAAVHT